MPLPVVRAYVVMLPALQAEESLRRVTELIAVNASARDRRRITDAWEMQARRQNPNRPRPPMNEQMRRVHLAKFGIAYIDGSQPEGSA